MRTLELVAWAVAFAIFGWLVYTAAYAVYHSASLTAQAHLNSY